MSQSRHPVDPQARRRAAEMLLFLAVSALGIYALGNGFNGLVEPSGGIGLGWFAVTGVAIVILFWQMGRVHDAWPHRPQVEGDPTPSTTGDDPATITRLPPSANKEITS